MELVAKSLERSLKGRLLYSGLDFHLRPGMKIVVQGASGAGKSQLLRHLSGLDAERAGELEMEGTLSLGKRSFSEWGACTWRREVSYTPQQVPRLSGTPEEFLARMQGFKAQVGRLGSNAQHLGRDLGLEASHWQQPWSELSVGERQRALLSIFIAREPAVLLLDEPTAALDPDSVLAVEALLHDRACIWVTHHAGQAERLADELITVGAKPSAE
ncbi:MAG: putative ABC transport system ATP-binding protein [Candidatus Paceibacteria bacterium]|jgi:putative ABC transport system ATP-binding protein